MSEIEFLGLLVVLLMLVAWAAIMSYDLGRTRQQKYDLQVEIKWIEKKYGISNKPKAEIYPSAIVCTRCRKKIKAIAHNTGEGWSFDLECECQDLYNYLHFDWPTDEEWISSREVKKLGFEEV